MLIVLDSIFVLLEMLIDVDLLEVEDPVPELLHGFSIAILTTFFVEIGLKVTQCNKFIGIALREIANVFLS